VSEIHISSFIDVRRYREQLQARRPENDPAVVNWRIGERCALMGVLGTSLLIYYLVSVQVEILSLPELYVSVPVKIAKPRSREATNGALTGCPGACLPLKRV
jgi:hypothetical protein